MLNSKGHLQFFEPTYGTAKSTDHNPALPDILNKVFNVPENKLPKPPFSEQLEEEIEEKSPNPLSTTPKMRRG